jgi:hypothetical protein
MLFVSVLLISCGKQPPPQNDLRQIDQGKEQSAVGNWTCDNSLNLIASMKAQWAQQAGATQGQAVVVAEVNRWWKGGSKNSPSCPDGGTIEYGVVGKKPTCTIHGKGQQSNGG